MKIYIIFFVLIGLAAIADSVCYILLLKEIHKKENEIRKLNKKIKEHQRQNRRRYLMSYSTFRKEVIKGLTCCTQSHQYLCEQCPYQDIKHLNQYNESEIVNEKTGERYDDYNCYCRLMQAALLVLETDEEEKTDHINGKKQ